MVSVPRLMFRKIVRSAKNNWGQFLAIVGIATLAVTLFLGLSANAYSFDERVDRFYEQGNVSDIWITVDATNEDDREQIKTYVDEVGGEIDERGYFPALFDNRDSFAIIAPDYPTICKPIIVDGEVDIEDENANYLIYDYSLADVEAFNEKINIGDTVSIGIPVSIVPEAFQAFFPAGQEIISLDFVTTATMRFNENIENGSYSAPCFIISESYLKQGIIEYFNNLECFMFQDYVTPVVNGLSLTNQYLITVNHQKNVNQLEKKIENYFYSKEEIGDSNLLSLRTLKEMPFNTIIQSDIDQATQLTYVFPFFFFFVAILVILTTISQLIIKERTEIGTLKAIGLSSKKIFLSYLALMLLLVGVGFIAGAIIGPLLIPYIMNIKYTILYTLPSMSYFFPWFYFGITFIVFAALTSLVVFLACHNELKLSPASSMRPAKYKALKTKKANTNSKKAPRFLSMRMAIRNIRLNYVKSFMVVFGIMGCTALLVCGFGIDDTIDHSINHTMENFYSSDIMLTYTKDCAPIKSKLLEYEGVESVEEMRVASITVTAKKSVDTKIYVVDGDHPFNHVDFDVNTIAVSQKVSQDAGVKVGDTITFSLLGTEYQGTVGMIYETFLKHGIYVNADNAQYASLYSVVNTGLVNVASGYDSEIVAENIKNDISEVGAATTKESTLEYVNDVVSSVSYMTLTVKVFAILLAVVVLYNLAYLNFKERIRLMATLKVLGFSNFDIAKSLVYETMILVFFGTLIGLALGFPVEYLVLYINRNSIVEFLYTVTPLTYIVSFVISFVTGLIINILLSLYIKNVKMVESLKSIE